MHLKILRRSRLLEQLDDARLTVLNAPPGSGKTELLRSWAETDAAEPPPVVWCTLTAETHDPTAFWAALSTAAANSGHATPNSAELLPHGPVFVVDDLHHVVHHTEDLWEELVTATDQGMRLAIASRWVPRDVIVRLSLRPHVRLFGPTQLAFTADEVGELLAGTGATDTGPDFVSNVLEETRGHALSVVAALVSSEAHVGVASDSWRTAVAGQVLPELEAMEVGTLVRDVAAAPHVDAALASVLTSTPQEQLAPLLARLETHGYGSWVQPSGTEPVFQLVPWVLTALRATGDAEAALRDADRAAAICEYLTRRGELGEALVVAVRARLYERATKLYRRLVVTQPFTVTSGLEPALREIPTDEIKKYPILSVARGVALLASPATSAGAMQFLLPIAERNPAGVDEGSADDDLLELTAQSVVLGVLGRHEAAALAALEAADRVADPEFAQAVAPELVTPLACQLSQSLFESGHVAVGERLLSQGISVAAPEMVRFCAIYGRAWYVLDGRLPEARDMDSRVSEGADHPRAAAAGVTWGPRTHDLETVGRAALLLDRWEFVAAADAVAEEHTPRWDHSRSWRAWVRLHAALGLGTSATEAQRIATSMEAASTPPGSLGFAALNNAMAIAWMANGQISRARRALDAVDDYLGQVAPAHTLLELSTAGPEAALRLLGDLRQSSGHTIRSRAALVTVGAACALRADARSLAVSLLTEAATLHTEHGSRVHLLYLPEQDRSALHSLALTRAPVECHAYLADLPTPMPGATSPVRLTNREQAVLTALATHRSRVNVAQALHVSENTVKSQMRSLYRKLGASDRPSAISRAIELDLLRSDQADVL